MAWIQCGLDQLWLGFIVVWINYGLAQISRAYGQRAKSPTRAVAALLARVKIYYNPHPYGLDSLWLGPIMIIVLLKIVEWSIEQNHVQFTLFNMLFGQSKSVQ